MKRFLLFLYTFFMCNIAIADDITINWGVDNQTYTTTTCEVGGDVALPTTPTKRGHIFRGWQKNYDRGTFSNWGNVPTDYRNYKEDYAGNAKPAHNDYIVVEDASAYIKTGDPIQIYNLPFTRGCAWTKIVINNQEWTYNHDQVAPSPQTIGIEGNRLKLEYSSGTWRLTPLDIPLIVDGIEKPTNNVALSWRYGTPSQETLYKIINYASDNVYIGTWRFSYQSDNWEIYGKNGWQPVEQISNE